MRRAEAEVVMQEKLAQARRLREQAAAQRSGTVLDPAARKACEDKARAQATLHEAKVAKARAEMEAKQRAEDEERERAMARHQAEARRLAQQQIAAEQALEEKHRRERKEAEARATAEKEALYASRADVLRAQERAAKERAARAATLKSSAAAEIKTATINSKRDGAFQKPMEEWGAGKSKIWKALNPQPLAYVSRREQEERREDRVVMGTPGTNSSDYAFLSQVSSDGVAPDADPYADEIENTSEEQFGGFDESPQAVEEEETVESEEEPDPSELAMDADTSDFMKQLAINRAKREKEEEARRAEIKKQYAAQKLREQEERDKEMAVIRAKKEIEQKKKEVQKEADVADAMKRMDQFVFDFTFS